MNSLRPIAYFRDRFVPVGRATVSIASAPVLYGLSIYTVFPVFWNDDDKQLYMFRVPDHFRRLQNSAKLMAFDDFNRQWDYEKFAKAMNDLLVKNKIRHDCLVRVNVFVDDILQGTRMHGLPHRLSAFVYDPPPVPKAGVRLGVSSWRRTPDNAIPSRAKINGSYVNASLMKHEAVHNGFDDAIALDEHGHVAESTVSNLFMVRDGRLVTPSNSNDLLEGITRDTVFQLADKLGIPHEQRMIDRSELYMADEIFLCGTSLQIAPAVEVDRRVVGNGKPGPITKQLMAAYQTHGHGRADKSWLTAVT